MLSRLEGRIDDVLGPTSLYAAVFVERGLDDAGPTGRTGLRSMKRRASLSSSSLTSPSRNEAWPKVDNCSSLSSVSTSVFVVGVILIVESDVPVDVLGADDSSVAGGSGRFQVKDRSFHFSKLSEQINGPRGISWSAGEFVLVEKL